MENWSLSLSPRSWWADIKAARRRGGTEAPTSRKEKREEGELCTTMVCLILYMWAVSHKIVGKKKGVCCFCLSLDINFSGQCYVIQEHVIFYTCKESMFNSHVSWYFLCSERGGRRGNWNWSWCCGNDGIWGFHFIQEVIVFHHSIPYFEWALAM